MAAPDPLPGVLPWFEAFWELSTDRAFAGGPIPATIIAAWPVEAQERATFRHSIRAADAAYLDHISKPNETPSGVATPAAVKGKRK